MGLSLPEAIGHQTLLASLLLGKKVKPGMHFSSPGWTCWGCPGGTDHGINISIMPTAIQLDNNTGFRVVVHGKCVLLDFICPLEYFYRGFLCPQETTGASCSLRSLPT